MRDKCARKALMGWSLLPFCIGSPCQAVTVATVGDSFADSLYNAMRARPNLIERYGVQLTQWSRPIMGLTRAAIVAKGTGCARVGAGAGRRAIAAPRRVTVRRARKVAHPPTGAVAYWPGELRPRRGRTLPAFEPLGDGPRWGRTLSSARDPQVVFRGKPKDAGQARRLDDKAAK
jgi:hypothetical protein